MFFNFLLAFSISLMIFHVILRLRLERVSRFRLKVLEESKYDYQRGEFVPYHDFPDFNTMLWEWWKPLKSYLNKRK